MNGSSHDQNFTHMGINQILCYTMVSGAPLKKIILYEINKNLEICICEEVGTCNRIRHLLVNFDTERSGKESI